MATLELSTGERFEISDSVQITKEGDVIVDEVKVKEDIYKKNKKLVFKALVTPDGTILNSMSQNDYKGHTDANGDYYSVDGGNDEYTWGTGDGQESYLHLYNDDPIEDLRYVVGRSGYGNPSSDDYGSWRCALLYQMSTSWVKASIEFTSKEYLKDLYNRELQYRLDNPKYDVPEDTEYFTNWDKAMEGSYSKIKSLL